MPDNDDDLRDLPIIREIGADLRAFAAQEDEHDATAERRAWWRKRPVVFAAVIALVAAAPAAAAIGGLWSPDTPPAPPMTTVIATTSSSSACPSSPADRTGSGTTDEAPPQEMLRAFGVLRTDQTTEDRAALKLPITRHLEGAIAPDLVRLLGTDAGGHRRWLVPSLIPAATTETAGCPGSAESPRWMLSLVGDGTGVGTSEYRQVIERGTTGSENPDQVPGRATVAGIVPDGVKSVTIAYPGDKNPPRTWPVSRNFFTYNVRLSVEQALPGKVTWNRDG